MLGVSGVLDDGGGSLVVVDVLQRGQWSSGDLLRCLHHSLQVFASNAEVLLYYMVSQPVKMLIV